MYPGSYTTAWMKLGDPTCIEQVMSYMQLAVCSLQSMVCDNDHSELRFQLLSRHNYRPTYQELLSYILIGNGTPQFTQWHNKSHSCTAASSEPGQRHVWVYTTPTYATLHDIEALLCTNIKINKKPATKRFGYSELIGGSITLMVGSFCSVDIHCFYFTNHLQSNFLNLLKQSSIMHIDHQYYSYTLIVTDIMSCSSAEVLLVLHHFL